MSHSRRHRPKIRVIALAAVCCVALVALSAPALAMPIRGPINAPNHPQGGPSPYVVKAGDNPADRYPSSTAVQTTSLRPGDTPATRVPAPARAVPLQLERTGVHDNTDRTLPIALAGSVLAIALAGSGIVVLRTRLPRAAGLH